LAAEPGVKGVTVFGINRQDTVGVQHQITIGTAIQFCINPLGEFGFVNNGAAASASGFGVMAAIGGNVQMFWGANTQAVYGPSYSINHGPQVTIVNDLSLPTKLLAYAVPVSCALYELAFAAMQVDQRIGLCEAAGILAAALTASLLTAETIDHAKAATTATTAAAEQITLLTAAVAQRLGMDCPTLISAYATVPTDQAKVFAIGLKSDKTPLAPTDTVSKTSYVQGDIIEIANGSVHLVARKDPTAAPPDLNPSIVSLSAIGDGTDGVILLDASKGIGINCYKAYMAFYAGFIDLQAGPTGSINIRSGGMGDVIIGAGILGTGPWPPPNPPPMPGSIIKVTAEGGIILACGQNTITLDTEGVTIDALMITLKAKAQFEIDTLNKSFTATISKHALTMHQIT